MANNMSDMIATMALNGATKEELNRVIEYSAAVIDAERARKDLGIDELEKKYMTVNAYDKIIKEMAETAKETGIPWPPKDPAIIPDVDCPVMSDPSTIEYEPKTFEEETDIMDCFFDKYESLIQTAPRNSLLGMIRDLENAVRGITGHRVDVDHLSHESENDENLKIAEACITHVAVLLAQMWADENEDIELTCVDPATGEGVTIAGKEKSDG